MRFGPRHHEAVVGHFGPGDEGLFARQAEPVASTLGKRSGLHRVRPGPRFGDRETELDITAAGSRQQFFLVELASVAGDMGQRHGRPDHHHQKRNAVIGGAFHEQGHFGHAKARAAIFLGHHDAEEAVIGDLAEHFVRKLVLACVSQPVIVVELLRQLAAIVVNLALFVVQNEIHASSSSLEFGGAPVLECIEALGHVIAGQCAHGGIALKPHLLVDTKVRAFARQPLHLGDAGT